MSKQQFGKLLIIPLVIYLFLVIFDAQIATELRFFLLGLLIGWTTLLVIIFRSQMREKLTKDREKNIKKLIKEVEAIKKGKN